jgi:hypothetical protein
MITKTSDAFAACRREAQAAVLKAMTPEEQAHIKQMCETISVNVSAHNPAAHHNGLGEVMLLEIVAALGVWVEKQEARCQS